MRPKLILQPAIRCTREDPSGWLDFLGRARRVFEAMGESPMVVFALLWLLDDQTKPDHPTDGIPLSEWAMWSGAGGGLKPALSKLIRAGVLVRTRHPEGKPTYRAKLPGSLQALKWAHPSEDEDETWDLTL